VEVATIFVIVESTRALLEEMRRFLSRACQVLSSKDSIRRTGKQQSEECLLCIVYIHVIEGEKSRLLEYSWYQHYITISNSNSNGYRRYATKASR
jgi:hypothetical protein